jgi:hypothetical protein
MTSILCCTALTFHSNCASKNGRNYPRLQISPCSAADFDSALDWQFEIISLEVVGAHSGIVVWFPQASLWSLALDGNSPFQTQMLILGKFESASLMAPGNSTVLWHC